jgi:predicted RNA-binding Zn-ribbon protein involved in translation (DUF1610 family)
LVDPALMVAFFGPSEQDLERLRSTVQSLGATSVPGLAAALSWRERKAEKLLAHELTRPNTPLVYEPGRRVVRWATSTPPAPAPQAPPPDAAPPIRLAPRSARGPAPVLTGSGFKTLCPSCHVALMPTGSASLAVCPQCGRLASPRAASPEVPEPVSVAPKPATVRNASGPSSLADRRSQELFAAYVTSKPIPCPKCRTPLRHRGLSEYLCPNCGQSVRFPKAAEPATVAAPPTGPA